ncbi:SusD/RagB family nutrient-binding outer membrane lipoprotein [Belliella marina]|uniref:SusD/RagB family nutrient-binding outer membrane lipoprotein n=1 Tax=Belliella marina TaxID=1644146 RepID=A0ABW4VG38_9BACT
MKKNRLILYLTTLCISMSCSVSDFEDNYTDPSKLDRTNVGKQFTGMIYSNREYVLPSYWDYYVVRRITSNRYSQAVGWINNENQYIPGSAAVGDRWNAYYNFLAQFRELEKVYDELPELDKPRNRIFIIAGSTYFYDQTQQVVDFHGDIPWSEAGMLSSNSGDYTKSYAGYDKATAIYTKMLDDLAGFADEIHGMELSADVQSIFDTQDLINRGDLDLWKKYINSLRLRILTRVSATSEFGTRAKAEINAILSDPVKYPIVTENADNVLFRIHSLGTLLESNQFQRGLEDDNGNLAGKKIIDHMLANQDPRLSYVFEPGLESDGTYLGLDPMMNPNQQNELVLTQTLAIYNRSTISRNQFFPGLVFTAPEVHLLAAEYYLKENQDAMAKQHYEEAIKKSIEFYVYLRSISNNSLAPAPVAPTLASINNYLAMDEVAWDGAADKLALISYQKWLHFNVVQPNENWHEIRRLKKMALDFWVDNNNQQSLPPSRWMYPGSEQTYNVENYSKVQSEDKLNNKLFWDVN